MIININININYNKLLI